MRLEIVLFDDAKNGITNDRAEAFQPLRFIQRFHGVQVCFAARVCEVASRGRVAMDMGRKEARKGLGDKDKTRFN